MRRLSFAPFRDADVLDTKRIDRYLAEIAGTINGGLDLSHFDAAMLWPDALHYGLNSIVCLARQLRYLTPGVPWTETWPHDEIMGLAGPATLVGIGLSVPRYAALQEKLEVYADVTKIEEVVVDAVTSPGAEDRIVIWKTVLQSVAAASVIKVSQPQGSYQLEKAVVSLAFSVTWEA